MRAITKSHFFQYFKGSDFVMSTMADDGHKQLQHYKSDRYKGIETISSLGRSYSFEEINTVLETSNMIDISTGHLKQSTVMLLEDLATQEILNMKTPIRVLSHRHGFIVYCTDPECLEEGSIPEELEIINRSAHDQDCILINFDQDAATFTELKYYQ